MVDDKQNVVFLELGLNTIFPEAPFNQGQSIYYDKHQLNEYGTQLYGEAVKDQFIQLVIQAYKGEIDKELVIQN